MRCDLRIFKTRVFCNWAKTVQLTDKDLKSVVLEIAQGDVGASLGAGLLKKRIAANSIGKSSGFRVIISYRTDIIIIFLLGYSKNDRENIYIKELIALKKMSKLYLKLDSEKLSKVVEYNELIEVL